MKRRITLSPSQMRTMGCRQQWAWAYRDGYKPRLHSPALELGSGIHAGLEAYYKDGVNPADYFLKWSHVRGFDSPEHVSLGVAMLRGYIEHWSGNDEFDVVGTEKTLWRKLPVPGTGNDSRCSMVVRLDLIVRCHRTGKLFSLDHKTYTKFLEKEIEVDPQFTAQLWVGKSIGLGEPLAGVIWNGLRKQKPSSRAKAPLFRRIKTFRNEHQLNAFAEGAYYLYKDSRQWEVCFAQPTPRMCNMCDFTEPCTEKQRGGDYEYLLENNYTKRGG